MCPACIAAAGMVAAGAISTGGLTAAIARAISKKKVQKDISKNEEQEL